MELHCRVETESAAGTISCRLGNPILNQPVMDPRVIILVNELRPLREHDGIRQINRDRRYRQNKFQHTLLKAKGDICIQIYGIC